MTKTVYNNQGKFRRDLMNNINKEIIKKHKMRMKEI